MIQKQDVISIWEWYKIIMDTKAEYIVRIQDMPLKYSVIEYYDGRIMTTGSLAKCKKWIKERRKYDYRYHYSVIGLCLFDIQKG